MKLSFESKIYGMSCESAEQGDFQDAGDMVVPHRVCQGRAWQTGPVLPPHPGAARLESTGTASTPGLGHLPGDRASPRLCQVKDPWLGKTGCWGLKTSPAAT